VTALGRVLRRGTSEVHFLADLPLSRRPGHRPCGNGARTAPTTQDLGCTVVGLRLCEFVEAGHAATQRRSGSPPLLTAGIIPAPEKDRRDRVRYATIRKEGRAGCRVTANTGPMREPRTVLRRMPCTIAEFQACASERDRPFRSAFGRWHRPAKGYPFQNPRSYRERPNCNL
jgi:hypothetical protein